MIGLYNFKESKLMSNKDDDSPYTPKNIPLYEALYGKNLISLGGIAAIDNMFSDIDLRGKHLLDVGFGLGGVAYYLATTRHSFVSGIEIHEWLAAHANDGAPQDIRDRVVFSIYTESNKFPFPDNSFDLVYSKGVFNHIKQKHPIFLEINRVLKSNGQLVIADWLHTVYENDDASPIIKETSESYHQVLNDTGFTNINIRDDSQTFVNYAEILLQNLFNNAEFIKSNYGDSIFDIINVDHQQLIADINAKRKMAVRITANNMR